MTMSVRHIIAMHLLILGTVTTGCGTSAEPKAEAERKVDVGKDHESAPPSGPGEKTLPELSIGDPAPPIHIHTWLKGTPVMELEKGKVYVIDFWATWCIPCVTAMPQTTKLQKRFQDKGLVVIGVTSTDSIGNTEDAIRKLVERKGADIGFAMGIDEPGTSPKAYQGVFRGTTIEAYLRGTAEPSLPAAFVIDRQGRLAFIGHPLEIDDAVEKCLEGTWDLRAAREQRAARLQAEDLLSELETALEAKDSARGMDLCRQLVNDVPHKNARVFDAVAHLMTQGATPLVRQDPDLTLKAARRAVELTKGTDPNSVGTLARVHFGRGEIEKAVETMTKAVALSEGSLKKELMKELETFRAPPGRKPENPPATTPLPGDKK
jgi:thiol-disulfide isomerase/thioredoxin